jgi:hypothetical protein
MRTCLRTVCHLLLFRSGRLEAKKRSRIDLGFDLGDRFPGRVLARRAPAKPTSATVPISIDKLPGKALFAEEASELLGGLDRTDGR